MKTKEGAVMKTERIIYLEAPRNRKERRIAEKTKKKKPAQKRAR